MPATLAAAAVTDAYRRRVIDTRDAAAFAAAALLDNIDLDQTPAGVNRDLETWNRRATVLAVAAGEQAADLSVTYLSTYLRASRANPLTIDLTPATPDPSRLVAVRVSLLSRLGQRAGREAAFRSAAATAQRSVRETIGVAAIQTLSDGIRREPQITGWRRVTAASCCARCAVQAGKTFRDNDGFLRHPACRCTHEPIVLGRAETYQRRSPTVVAA